jgi:hypothetical protein
MILFTLLTINVVGFSIVGPDLCKLDLYDSHKKELSSALIYCSTPEDISDIITKFGELK